MNDLEWDDVRVFLALARGGSVRRAGVLLGVHHSTVARRLDSMESRMGVTLFTRRTRGLELAPAGSDLLTAAERVEAEMASIQRQLAGHDSRMSGRLRLTLPDAVATGFLMDDLAEFLADNLELELHLIASNALLDLSRGEADVAVRITETPPEHLVGRPLGRVAMAPYASAAYLANHDPQRQPAACRWLGWDQQLGTVGSKDAGLPNIPVWGSFASVLLQQAAAAAGLGIALLPTMLAASDSRLQRVPGGEVVPGTMAWVLTHPELRRSARVRALVQQITAAFDSHRREFSGGLDDQQATATALSVPETDPRAQAG